MNTEFPSVIDATQVTNFRACPQRFNRMYMEHWKPKGESIHLHAGKVFARGLEVARQVYYEEQLGRENAVNAGFKALTEAYGDFECPSQGSGTNKSLDRMQGAFLYYFDQAWPFGATNGATPHKFPSGRFGIEFSFAVPLPYRHPVTGDPIIYAGRSDMICDFAQGVYIEDDKTTSQLGASWSKQWDLRSQFTGYCWAARETGIHVNGVLVRGVSILKTKYDHAEAITYRADWEIDLWLKQTLRNLAQMEAMWREGYWDFNLADACNEYGGCPLKQICKSPEPEAWLPMYFERRRWDPLARTELPVEVTNG